MANATHDAFAMQSSFLFTCSLFICPSPGKSPLSFVIYLKISLSPSESLCKNLTAEILPARILRKHSVRSDVCHKQFICRFCSAKAFFRTLGLNGTKEKYLLRTREKGIFKKRPRLVIDQLIILVVPAVKLTNFFTDLFRWMLCS